MIRSRSAWPESPATDRRHVLALAALFALASSDTRSMKGSLVFRSWKSWADKLHQQLPLSPRESQRLLAALTTSFRKHLDEAYPPTASQDGRPTVVATQSKQKGRPLHSSAAVSADKHLASILTSPLLVKGPGGGRSTALHKDAQAEIHQQVEDVFASVKAELAHGVRDPITIFEEVAERGSATPRIARACLQSFEDALSGRNPEQKQAMVAESQPGKRVLLAMWKRNMHQSEAFVDDKELIRLLTFALMREHRDDYLWDWIKVDMVLADRWGQAPEDVRRSQSSISRKFHHYRWKGRILSSMTHYWLDPRDGTKGDINPALDVFDKAVELQQGAMKLTDQHHMRWLPLGAIGIALETALTSPILPAAGATTDKTAFTVDPVRFDRFVDNMELWSLKRTTYSHIGHVMQRAVLQLRHPVKPSAHLFVETAKRWFAEYGPDAKTTPPPMDDIHITSGSSESMHHYYCAFVRALYLSERAGILEDAEWLRKMLQEYYPQLQRYVEPNLQRLRRLNEHDLDADQSTDGRLRVTPARPPFPTFN